MKREARVRVNAFKKLFGVGKQNPGRLVHVLSLSSNRFGRVVKALCGVKKQRT